MNAPQRIHICRPAPLVRDLGQVAYEPAWKAMCEFTAKRRPETPDEIWLLEHPPVYTVGLAGKPEHLPRIANGIPVIHSDRGGQITYHGPGQIVAYLLLDMRRLGLTVLPLVRHIETAVINLLAGYGIAAAGRIDAPGVYVGGEKIAALGLRVRAGCCYHGVALNFDMDLAPFSVINPCGYRGLPVTDMKTLGIVDTREQVRSKLAEHLLQVLP